MTSKPERICSAKNQLCKCSMATVKNMHKHQSIEKIKESEAESLSDIYNLYKGYTNTGIGPIPF